MNLDNILSIHNSDIEVLFYFHNKFECYTTSNFPLTRLVQEPKHDGKILKGSPEVISVMYEGSKSNTWYKTPSKIGPRVYEIVLVESFRIVSMCDMISWKYF